MMPRPPQGRAGFCRVVVGGWLLVATAAAAASAVSTDACLQAELASQPQFSGVAMLRQKGRVHVATHGQADAAGKALQPGTRFNLGSASKMFTAVAVAQLVAQDKLALDAPIGRWVDGLTPPIAAVTLRQLLTHSGGLGNFVVPESLAALQQAKTLDRQMALVEDVRPLFEPGTRFRYSNTGFLLLGRAVERASGQTFAGYLQSRVFEPAGMTQTSLDPALPVVAATGFTRLPEFVPGEGPGVPGGPAMAGAPRDAPATGALPPAPPPPPPGGPLRAAAESALPGSPAGSAYSTAGDMARFFDALEAGKLVTADWVKQLTGAHINASPPGAPLALEYGLGFDVSRWQGHRSFGHNGGAPGVNVEAVRYPDDDILIVVLSNRDPPLAGRVLAALRHKAFGGTLCR